MPEENESLITGVCTPHVSSLCDFAYYGRVIVCSGCALYPLVYCVYLPYHADVYKNYIGSVCVGV